MALVGGALSLVANAVSPRGLKLSRDYFPTASAAPGSGSLTNGATAPGYTNAATPLEALAERLREKGISMVDSNQAIQWFNDPKFREERIIFLDVRDDAHYQGGHIPSAYQFNYYQPDQHLPVVLQAGQLAEQILLYCNGGNCEDSELAAQMLSSAFPPGKLHVYSGGMSEWSSNSLPVELGARNSGVLKNAPR